MTREEMRVCPECLGLKRLSGKKGICTNGDYDYIEKCLKCTGTGKVKVNAN